MGGDNKNRKSQAEDIRKELDALIGNNDLIESTINTDPELPSKKDLPVRMSYTQLKESASRKASRTITSLMKFYLDEDIIEKDEYIIAKKKIDEMTMSSLIYQLQAGERALTTLLETIEDGEIAPRMFEVLATLQKSMLDIIKSQTMYLMAAEEGAKRMARDIELYKKRDDTREISESTSRGPTTGDNVQRGTKDIMRMIQEGIKNDDIEDAEITEE
jgi:hypothetical protein